jgi:hypothetical protein
MAALVPEKVYVCDSASSVPNSSAVPVRSYSEVKVSNSIFPIDTSLLSAMLGFYEGNVP